MKKYCILSIVLLLHLLTGCLQTRYITERYIKNEIEQHENGNHSSIKTYSIFKGIDVVNGGYIELTGYKYDSHKGLIIGTDKYYEARDNFKGDPTIIAAINFIELDIDQCQSILDNYILLLDKIKSERPKRNEEVYHDYTVSTDLFISYHKSTSDLDTDSIDLWVRGEKYSIATSSIMAKLRKFLDY